MSYLGSNTLKVYPNPAVDKAYFEVFLDEPCEVKLEIIDGSGHVIAIMQESGSDSLIMEWDCTNMSGNRLKSGLYFCRIQTRNSIELRKLIIL